MSDLIKKYLVSLEDQDESLETEELDSEESEMDGEHQEPLESDTVSGVDETETLIQNSSDAVDEQERTVNNAVEATAALESYIDLLNKSGRDGISQETAAFMNVGMGLISKHLNNASLGLEDYSCDPRNALRKANVSVEDLKDKLKVAREYIIKLFNELWETMVSYGKKVGSGLLLVERSAKNLREKMKSNKDSLTPYTDITVNATAYYYIDGKPVDDLSSEITETNKYVGTMIPEVIEDGLGKLEKIAKDLVSLSDIDDDYLETLNKTMELIYDNILSKVGIKERIFPGNYRLVYKHDGKGIKLTLDPDLKEHGEEYHVENFNLVRRMNFLDKNIQDASKLHSVSVKIEDKIAVIKKSIMATPVEGDDLRQRRINSIISKLMRDANAVSMAVYGNMRYLAILIRHELKLCEKALSMSISENKKDQTV